MRIWAPVIRNNALASPTHVTRAKQQKKAQSLLIIMGGFGRSAITAAAGHIMVSTNTHTLACISGLPPGGVPAAGE